MQKLQHPAGVSARIGNVEKVVFYCVVDEIDAKALKLKPSEFGILMYLKLQENLGKPAPTRKELLDALPIGPRTLDGALAELKRRELISRAVVFRVTEKARAI